MSRFTPAFEELVDLFCDGTMSPQQAAQLEALAGESAEARQYLRDSFLVHCELAWEVSRDVGQSAELAPPDFVNYIPDLHPAAPRSSGLAPGIFGRWPGALATVAVVTLFALGLWGLVRSTHLGNRSSLPGVQVASVGAARGCGENAPATGSLLRAEGKLAIDKGLLEVRFDHGATMILQGPTEVRLRSDSAADLESGCVTVECVRRHTVSLSIPPVARSSILALVSVSPFRKGIPTSRSSPERCSCRPRERGPVATSENWPPAARSALLGRALVTHKPPRLKPSRPEVRILCSQ